MADPVPFGGCLLFDHDKLHNEFLISQYVSKDWLSGGVSVGFIRLW